MTTTPLGPHANRADAAVRGAVQAPPAADDRRRLDSQALFGAAQEVEITHGGAVYRLRRTALGKLILTK